ncbi:hypothetical protein ACFQ2B_31915 [Streptomyces stramineus]
MRELRRAPAGPGGLTAEHVAALGPAEIAETLLARLGDCSPHVRAVLDAVSVAAPGADGDLVARLSGAERTAAADALYRLVRCGVLTEGPEGTGFRHPVVAAAFRARIPPGERARLHAEAAQALYAAGAPASASPRTCCPARPSASPGPAGCSSTRPTRRWPPGPRHRRGASWSAASPSAAPTRRRTCCAGWATSRWRTAPSTRSPTCAAPSA